MQHTKSSLEIFYTTEYGRFKMINGNRELNEQKIKRILADIESGIDVLLYYPIQVFERNDRLEIEDGQHRFHISKTLKRPVHYIIMKEERQLMDIAKINSNVEKWKTRDYINCYCQLDNVHYLKLRDFIEIYGISCSLAVTLLATGTPTRDGEKQEAYYFERGEFQIRFEIEATSLADKVQLFKQYSKWKNKNFFIAIHKILMAKVVSIEDLAAKFNNHVDSLSDQVLGFREYIFALETIYNKGMKSRVVIWDPLVEMKKTE